jgi:hypothetical protein
MPLINEHNLSIKPVKSQKLPISNSNILRRKIACKLLTSCEDEEEEENCSNPE